MNWMKVFFDYAYSQKLISARVDAATPIDFFNDCFCNPTFSKNSLFLNVLAGASQLFKTAPFSNTPD